MAVDDEASKQLFESRAKIHNNINSVLDAGLSTQSIKSNVLHDYFSKKYVQEQLKVTKSMDVLDFGCGVGRLTHFLAPKVNTIAGFDISNQMIQIAKTNSKDTSVFLSNQLTDFDSSRYDLIFSHWVLAHMNDETIVSIFKSLNQRLKPTGRLCIFEQTYTFDSTKLANEIYQRRSVDEYEQLFNQANFKITKYKHVYRTPSYARSIWNRLPISFKFLMPFLYFIEKKTLNYKKQNVEYYTTFIEFRPM